MVTVAFVILICDSYQAVRPVPSRHCIFAERHCQGQCELAMAVFHDIKGAARKLRLNQFAECLLFAQAHISS